MTTFRKTQSLLLAFLVYPLGLFLLFTGAGCQHSDICDFVSMDQVRVSLDKALEMADQRAEKMLVEEMSNPGRDRKPIGRDGKPLTVADYNKKVSVDTLDNRPTMFVGYGCREFLGYLGGYNGFSIRVFLDTGEMRILGGQ